MSRLISDILNAPEPHFSRTIQNWERLSNNAGHDLRLVSEVSAGRKFYLKNLGLDEDDTTPRELYYALRHKAADTNKKFEEKLGIKDDDSPEKVIAKVVKFIESQNLASDLWAIKPPVIKQILKKSVPKKLLKTLGLRSVDSVLKRTDPREILALAYFIESPEWTKKINTSLKNLSPNDFQNCDINILIIPQIKTKKLRKTAVKNVGIIKTCYEIGTVIITPPAKRFNTDSLGYALILTHQLHEASVYSSYFRYISVKNDFGHRFVQAIREGLPGKLNQLSIGWKPLHQHLQANPETFSKIEQPYLQTEHIAHPSPYQLMENLIPDGNFWKGGDIVFMTDNKHTASVNLVDVIINSSNGTVFENSKNPYLQSQLWQNLGSRYLQNGQIEALVISDID